MATNTLSDVSIRKITTVDRPIKLYDGGGLYLLVKPNGSRLWRFKIVSAESRRGWHSDRTQQFL